MTLLVHLIVYYCFYWHLFVLCINDNGCFTGFIQVLLPLIYKIFLHYSLTFHKVITNYKFFDYKFFIKIFLSLKRLVVWCYLTKMNASFQDKKRLLCFLCFLGHLLVEQFLVSFLNVFASLQWVTTRAVMDSDCLCHLLFWSFCSELWRKVKRWKLWPKLCPTVIVQWAIFHGLFSSSGRVNPDDYPGEQELDWNYLWSVCCKMFSFFMVCIFSYLCFSLWVACCCLLTCN